MLLELSPGDARALEALARLRESTGDADAALRAIEAIAEKATSPELKAEQWMRAAKLLESRGNTDAAIERYKRALEENPRDATAASALGEAFVARSDFHSALQFMERELEHSEGSLKRAALLGRMALLHRDQLHDERRAEECARRALDLDPTHFDSQRLLADMAFENGRYLEARRLYEGIVGRTERLANPTQVLGRYIDALAQTGASEKALGLVDDLLAAAGDDHEALLRALRVCFDHGTPARAAELATRLLDRFGTRLDESERADALYRQGESLRRAERLNECISPLERAAELDPADAKSWIALARAYEAEARFEDAIRAKTRQLDAATGEDRVQVLIETAEIAASKLDDGARAAKILVTALEERPDDRRVLTKLMQLYSDEKDWNKLVDVVLRLAEFVEDPKQKVKYLHSAAIVVARQVGDVARALEIYAQILALEPGFDRALVEAIELEKTRANPVAVERLLKQRLELASSANDQETMIRNFDDLAALYERELGWTEQAIDAYEAAQTLDPENRARSESLARLYSTDPDKYRDRAIEGELASLRHDPYRAGSYRALRRLFTEAKQADPAFCLCQALSVLELAEPDEERFYRRMRSQTAAPAVSALTDDDWLMHVLHPDADSFLTSVFALIEASVIAKRGQSLAELGYDPRFQLNLAEHPAPLCQSIYFAAGVLGIPLPPTYANPNDTGGVSFLFAHDPSLVLGLAAMQPDVPLQPAAFIAARNLTYLRPGMYLRHLLASGTALKAWLFAAIKLTAPAFPVAPELEGAVNEALAALDAGIQGQVRDHLNRVVSKLLTSGTALDLKRWVAAVDLTADRAGLITAHDLEIAVHLVRASEDDTNSLTVEERVRELVLYSVSPDYFQIRQRLGIALDA
jgi:tetratricopeptide (TPR) repeat protein